jgi:hypothetical protein
VNLSGTSYRMGDRGSEVQLPAVGRYISLLHSANTCPGTDPVSYALVTGVRSSWGKAAGT